MEKFILFHTRYKDVQIGYFEQERLVELYSLDNIRVSKCLLSTVEDLFQQYHISLSEISFLAAHIGPAPYTTLRVVLATLNGIHFSRGTPLVGVNGLDAFLKYLPSQETNVILLNAFGNDLYYGISNPDSHTRVIGCKNVDDLLKELAQETHAPIQFFGNGAVLYRDKIEDTMGKRAIIMPSISSLPGYNAEIIPIQFLAKEALENWRNHLVETQLFPLYLK